MGSQLDDGRVRRDTHWATLAERLAQREDDTFADQGYWVGSQDLRIDAERRAWIDPQAKPSVGPGPRWPIRVWLRPEGIVINMAHCPETFRVSDAAALEGFLPVRDIELAAPDHDEWVAPEIQRLRELAATVEKNRQKHLEALALRSFESEMKAIYPTRFQDSPAFTITMVVTFLVGMLALFCYVRWDQSHRPTADLSFRAAVNRYIPPPSH